MSKSEQAQIQKQLNDMWELVDELSTLSTRLKEAADKAIEAFNAKKNQEEAGDRPK